MTTKEDMELLYPSNRQEGGDHYAKHNIQPYTLYIIQQLVFFSRQCYKIRGSL
jgi:hypothetical protein